MIDKIYSTGSAADKTVKLSNKAGKNLSTGQTPHQMEDIAHNEQRDEDQRHRRDKPSGQISQKSDRIGNEGLDHGITPSGARRSI